ncbi:MAG TPA: right-handed parallel beta-helix repeat-containing protein, partial [Lacibacter sp.]|nr:right-handed parallel beta-helix repeat-containing protein [Lacibacter sp.]
MNQNFYFRRSYRLLLMNVVFLLVSHQSFSRAYYFSSAGDDNHTATQAQNPATPWRTLSRLNSFMSSLVAGDSILFRRGDTFYGGMTVNRSGLIFAAYGSGSNPVISGFQLINFTSAGGNIWESTVALPVQPQTFVFGGSYRLPARFPNTGFRTMTAGTSPNTLTDNQLTGDWVGGEVVPRKNNWTTDRGRITSQSGTTLTYQNVSPDEHQSGWGYYLQHHPNAMDLPGEWYYNTSSQKVFLFSTSVPTSALAGQTARLVQLTAGSNSFNGLDFEGANDFTFHLSNAAGTSITNCNIRYSGSFAIYGSNSNTIRIQGCRIEFTNNVAILLTGCRTAQISNNYIHTTGIEGTGRGLNVTALEYSAISLSGGDGTIVEGNSIINTGYNAIHFLFGNNYNIRNNFIDGFNIYKDDGGGIYTWNGTSTPVNYTGIRITGNIVLNGKAAPAGRTGASYLPAYGIYMDDNAANVELLNNTVADCAGSGIFLHNAHDLVLRGNVMYNNGSASADPAGAGQLQVLANAGSWLVRNVQMFDNILVSRRNNQLVMKWDTDYNDIQQFGTADSNFFCRPISDNQTIRLYSRPWTSALNQTLNDWRSFSGQDPNSRRSPRTISSLDSIRFYYNETSSPRSFGLGANFIDMKGVLYPGTITLPPHSGTVLVYHSRLNSNQNPVANAGPDRTITLPTNTVTLNGSGTDPDGSIASFQWVRLSGPNTPTIVSPTAAQTVINNLIQGTYQFELRVTDNLGAIGRDTVQVTVNPAPNQAPTANAGPDLSITLPTNSVTLNGSGSDVDGTIASFQWTRISGPNTPTIASPNAAQTAVSGMVQGTYRFELRVTDNQGAIGRDTVQVTVNPAPNQ